MEIVPDLPVGQWVAQLSGGEIIAEGQLMNRESSPWKQLQQLVSDTGQAVKALALFADDGRVFYAPRADGYWHVRAAQFSIFGRLLPQYAIAIGYHKEGKRHELWVTAGNQSVLVRPWSPDDGAIVAGYWTEERCQTLTQQQTL